ncbi:type VI secretion system protein [Variovorax sp. J2P1-59]|uniref:type VI secretion system protein n=1 Tax=Variovorax flavidus TaxID=3053501 RepID=UPI0025754870|nr:type VI secretion system protein [Variovorax sp. J2P1-59]MDM0078248.1 type VI secretion system protein [Variovorax sp. J2P1-59]
MTQLPAHFWPLLALCLLAFLSLWWIVLGSSRAARRRMLRLRIAALGQEKEAPSRPAELQQSLAHARQALQRSPDPPAVRNPLYAIPWFVFIGDASANVAGLLDAAVGTATPKPYAERDDVFWHWRGLPSMIAIETSPAALGDPADPHERSLWYRALLELAERRERLPLNGIVVCVGASTLLGDAAERDAVAARVRTLVHEAAEHLGLLLPVYFFVTGLEQLRGFDVVRAALPDDVLSQALGHCLTHDAAPRIEADAELDVVFGEIMRRLHALRMALLRGEQDPVRRQAIHAFAEEVRSLQQGLRAMAQRIFGYGHGPHSPRWRGLYLTAAPQEGRGGAFVHDLFAHFLPADQPLARSRNPGGLSDSYFGSTQM